MLRTFCRGCDVVCAVGRTTKRPGHQGSNRKVSRRSTAVVSHQSLIQTSRSLCCLSVVSWFPTAQMQQKQRMRRMELLRQLAGGAVSAFFSFCDFAALKLHDYVSETRCSNTFVIIIIIIMFIYSN